VLFCDGKDRVKKNFLIRRIPQTPKLGLEEIKSLSCVE
jgi:hypothetical protein